MPKISATRHASRGKRKRAKRKATTAHPKTAPSVTPATPRPPMTPLAQPKPTRSQAQPAVPNYRYVTAELRRIGIIAGGILAFLLILALILR